MTAPLREPVEPPAPPSRLTGRSALVTGVSRRRGIGSAVAARLLGLGASVAVHHHAPHDARVYGAADDLPALLDDLRAHLAPGASLVEVSGDLGTPDGPSTVVQAAAGALGHLDILVCNQAHSGDEVSLGSATAAAFDVHWNVNARASLLLTQAFAAQHDGRPGVERSG